MLNSVDAGRRLMLRAAVYPLAAVAVLALAFLLVGPKYALGALASGVAISAGGWVAARMALGGGALAAGPAGGVPGLQAACIGAVGRYRRRSDVPGPGHGQALTEFN